MPIARLDRDVIRISGENAVGWLDGLITNSISGPLTFAALLSPQGKILADFFISQSGDALLIDTAEKFTDSLLARLKLYRLRAKIDIEKTKLCTYALWNGSGEDGELDPRGPALGRRLIAPFMDTQHGPAEYDLHRLRLGIPDSRWDFDSGLMFPATANMDRLDGIDFKKGCFIGQEVASRMHRKTEVRKRMHGFISSGDLTDKDINLNGKNAGQVLHQRDGLGMALIRLDRIGQEKTLSAGNQTINLLDI